jgi:hypothetical protein
VLISGFLHLWLASEPRHATSLGPNAAADARSSVKDASNGWFSWFPDMCFKFLKTCSTGLKSAKYLERHAASAPAVPIASRTAAAPWVDRLCFVAPFAERLDHHRQVAL